MSGSITGVTPVTWRTSCPSRATRPAPSRVPLPPPRLCAPPGSPLATASTCHHRCPVRPTAAAVHLPSTLHGHTSRTHAPAFRAPPLRTHPPLRLDGLLPPAGFPMLGPHPWHICPTPTYRDMPQLTPSSPPHASHPPWSHPWGLAPLKASRHPTTRLAAPPRISGHHYASPPATTHVVTTPTTRASPTMLLANPLPPTTRPALLHTLLWPLSCVLTLRFRRLRSHLRGVRRH